MELIKKLKRANLNIGIARDRRGRLVIEKQKVRESIKRKLKEEEANLKELEEHYKKLEEKLPYIAPEDRASYVEESTSRGVLDAIKKRVNILREVSEELS